MLRGAGRSDAEFRDVGRGWEPAASGGLGFGAAAAVGSAPRSVPFADGLLRDGVPPAPEGGGYGADVRLHNVEPRRREQRRRLQDKEGAEKERLRERRGGYHRFTDPGRLVAPDDATADAYIAESDRFVTDVVGEERLRREESLARKAATIVRRREETVRREEERWKKMEDERREEDERVAKLRAAGVAAKKNEASVPYDILSQKYKDTSDGLRLRHQDQMTMWRASARAQMLQIKSRGSEFHPVTGERINVMDLPPPPIAPPLDDEGDDEGEEEEVGGHHH